MNDQTIMNKMIKELQLAKGKDSRQEVITHIGHVKLLCELFLEEASSNQITTDSSTFSQQEIKVMLGEKQGDRPQKKQQSAVEHDEANGTSIFDF